MTVQTCPHKNVYHTLKLCLMLYTSGLAQILFASLDQNLEHLPQGLNLVIYVWYMSMKE